MTDKELMQMAQEAGIVVTGEAVWKLCQLVYEAGRKDENEACAKVSENGCFLHDDSPEARFGKACAAAIRARREQ